MLSASPKVDRGGDYWEDERGRQEKGDRAQQQEQEIEEIPFRLPTERKASPPPFDLGGEDEDGSNEWQPVETDAITMLDEPLDDHEPMGNAPPSSIEMRTGKCSKGVMDQLACSRRAAASK